MPLCVVWLSAELCSAPCRMLAVEVRSSLAFHGSRSTVPLSLPLHQAALDMLTGAEPRIRDTGLSQMHLAMDAQWNRSKSFKPHRRKFNGPLYNSEHGESLRREFQRFICGYIAPHVREHTGCKRIYFQSTPCLRIQPPSNNRGMICAHISLR